MATKTIRISSTGIERAKRLAKVDSTSLGHVIDQALAFYERERVLTKYDEDMARLRSNPRASAEYDAEVTVWDTALLDGLVDAPDEEH